MRPTRSSSNWLAILSARRSLSVFLAGVVCLACWQVWLTWRLVQQDQNLELQRSRERLEQIAHLAIAQLGRNLGDWELALRELGSLPPAPSLLSKLPRSATIILISHDAVSVYPQRPLMFVPESPVVHVHDVRAFDAADQLELRDQQFETAIAALRPLVSKPQTRPEALLRIARIQRKSGRPEAALATYRQLEDETALNASDVPYALLAASARCKTLAELGKKRDAAVEAERLRSNLLSGRWPIRRETFEYHWAEFDQLGTPAGQPPQAACAFAVLVSELYDRCKIAARTGASSNGRDPQPDSSLLLWNISPDHAGALLTSPGWLQSSLTFPPNASKVSWKLLSPGAPAEAGLSVTRSLSEVRLPGRIQFFNAGPAASGISGRRTLWFTGVALMLTLVLASGYAVQRGVSQELRTSRLQSDFVAAVSHEFRSPLTTLRTISELLAQNRIADESRRQQSYVFLNHETNRLHRLVEDLLDFGRMESGRKQYRLEARDALQLARATVIDFSPEAAANGFRIETNLTSATATVHADEEAFRRALRNLLENAIKYSPDCKTVWVDAVVEDHRVAISVRDRGMGIDPSEHREIFQKFVRGAAAKKAGIKGTGIGLSMVHQICRALGGEIRVESKPGAGSTFTIVLPLVEC